MLNVTALLGSPSPTDDLRYGHRSPLRSAGDRRPVVVWSCTRRCNLACRHRDPDPTSQRYHEMSTGEAMAFVADIAGFGSPALLLSGGEPLMRPDVMEVVEEARARGLPVALSSNGTLIDGHRARRIAEAGVRYVGIGIDGDEAAHDRFRGRRGAHARAVAGIRALKEEGVRVGLRVRLTATAIAQLPWIFALAEREGVDRACFSHLVPAGRGASQEGVPAAATRRAVESIFRWADDLVAFDAGVEVLTAGNHADGPALVLREELRDLEAAETMREQLAWNGGARNSSGRGFAAVSCEGRVTPDPFWGGPALGWLAERPLSAIWSDPPDLLRRLRARSDHLTGRCASCRFLELCGGGLASRALAAGAGLDGSDPGCHLTDAEIAVP